MITLSKIGLTVEPRWCLWGLVVCWGYDIKFDGQFVWAVKSSNLQAEPEGLLLGKAKA